MMRIAIIGPESTGKTELCTQLAKYFHCDWVPELAREYVELRGNVYTYEDVVEIARLQIAEERKYEDRRNKRFVFFDTELIITKVWLEYKYQQVPDFVEERLSERFYDFYLLCEPDLPWIYDPVRENGDNRDFFFDWYEREIQELEIPYAIIGGVDILRFENAVKAVLRAEKDFLKMSDILPNNIKC